MRLPIVIGCCFVVQAAVAEPCLEGEESCSAEPTALLQKPRLSASLASAGAKKRASTSVVHLNWNSKGPKKLEGVPNKPKHVQTTQLCDEVDAILSTDPEVSDARTLWKFCCDDARRGMLQELKTGCLYVPTNKHLETFFNTVERSDPWGFLQMWEDSFVEINPKGLCPTDDHSPGKTRAESEVEACPDEPGFLATDGNCIKADHLGEAKNGKVRVKKLDGLMGLDATSLHLIERAGDETVSENSLLTTAKRRTRTGKVAPSARVQKVQNVSIPIKYILCDSGTGFVHSYVTPEKIALQTDVLNKAYGGQDQCAVPLSYERAPVDTGFRFHSVGTERITSSLCAWDCKNNDALLHKVAPREDGMIKVLVCDTSLLGFASFPGWPDQWRLLVVNPGTFPGGYLTNYNFGDTLTHEMGHYLGLEHTFEGGCSGGDGAADTAPEAIPFYGCSSSPRSTCSGATTDPTHNFMDYADDQCMCRFTDGQVQDMLQTLTTFQPDLLR